MPDVQPEMLGYLAGSLTTVSFVPQVLHVYRNKSARDVSLAMIVLFSLGVLCWMLYGVWIASPPVILTNALTLILALSIVVANFRWPG